MPDLRANSTQGTVNNSSVPLIDNAGRKPDPMANITHGIHNNGSVPVDSTVIDGLNKTTVSRNSTQGPVPVRLDDNPPGVVSSNYSSQSPKSMQNSSVAAPDLVPSSTELKLLRGVCSWKDCIEKWVDHNEASLNELGIADLENEKSFSRQISLPTSMMSSMDLWTCG